MKLSPLALWWIPIGLLFGCASTPPIAPDRLPFHVALAVNIVDRGSAPRGDSSLPDSESIPFVLTADEVAGSLRAALEHDCFHRVTVLPEEPRGEAAWIEGAGDADLLVVATLTHDSRVMESDEAEDFSVGKSLTYVIPGPGFWLDQDRIYTVGATLSLSVCDLSRSRKALAGGELEVDDLRYFEHQVSQDEVTLCFWDRSGQSAWHLATSFFVPSRYLDGDEESIEESISFALVEQLVRKTADDLLLQRLRLLRNPEQFLFYLEPTESEIATGATGGIRLRWTLYHEQGERKNLPLAYRIYAHPGRRLLVERELDEAELLAASRRIERGGRSYLRCRFEEELLRSEGAKTIQLEVDASSRSTVTRSFSFPVPPIPEPE